MQEDHGTVCTEIEVDNLTPEQRYIENRISEATMPIWENLFLIQKQLDLERLRKRLLLLKLQSLR